MRFTSDRQRKAVFSKLALGNSSQIARCDDFANIFSGGSSFSRGFFSEGKKGSGMTLGQYVQEQNVPDWVVSNPTLSVREEPVSTKGLDELVQYTSENINPAKRVGVSKVSDEYANTGFTELAVRTNPKRLKKMDELFNNLSEDPEKPDYSLETWQKNVAGVPKYKIDRYYRGIWDVLEPQLENRNILIRYLHGGHEVVRRHPPGSSVYTTIKDVDELSELVREHAIEIWEETAKKGDLNRGDMAVLDIDNLGDASEKDMKKITKETYKRMGKSFGGKPYIINTQGGYHVGVKLGNSMPYKTMRNKTDKEVIAPIEEEYGELVSRHYDKAPIYLDKTPQKIHGSTKIIGSLNLPDLIITEKINVDDLDGFKRSRL